MVSVIIPCYNQGQYLAEAIDSVLAQSYLDWEIWIINDGSVDNTEEIALNYVKSNPKIHYIFQKNKGVSSARNNGVGHANGAYILPLDADDKIAPDYLFEGVSYMDAHPECTLFYCEAFMFGRIEELWQIHYIDYKSLLLYNCIFCSSIFRKEDFLQIGGYDENFKIGYEDWEFYIRLLHGEKTVYQCSTPLFFYRQKDTKSRSDGANEKEASLFDMIYNKHAIIYHEYYPNYININRCFLQKQRQLELQINECSRMAEQIVQLKKNIKELREKLEVQTNRKRTYMAYWGFRLVYRLVRAYRKKIKHEVQYL